MSESDYYVIFKTIQCYIVKTLFESLKDLLIDINIEFRKDGIRVCNMDGTKSTLTYLYLEAKKINQGGVYQFNYTDNNLSILRLGVNTNSLFTIIKSVGKEDIISFYVMKNDTDHLYITINSPDRNTTINSKLKLLQLKDETLEFPQNIQLGMRTSMSSNDFHKLCKTMSNFSTQIQIIENTIEKEIRFICRGDSIDQELIVHPDTFDVDKDSDEIVEGTFPLKYVLFFTKASGLSSSVHLCMKKDNPLIVEYKFDLGTITFAVSPIDDE